MKELLVLVWAMVVAVAVDNSNATEVGDGQLSMLKILSKYGYPGEAHDVITADGYILKLYRIPYGQKCGPDATRKSPILLQHGLLSNAIDWIISGIGKGLGYLLADDCFDVWLGNSRGNFESQRHTNMSRDQPEFWNFSWHEMGEYDLPALINHILNVTGASGLHYVGHSQGTTQSYIYASMYPEESAKKMISVHSLAPVAYVEHLKSPALRWLAQNINLFKLAMNSMGMGEVIPHLQLPEEITSLVGDSHPGLQVICANVLFFFIGFDGGQWNATLLPLIGGHDPAGSSTMQLMHYGQEIKSGKFRRYDHGEHENTRLYGQKEPPNYQIGNIQVPVYLWYGENDWMATVPDVERFAKEVSTAELKKVPLFNHLDFMWAKDAKKMLYDPMFEILNAYEKQR